MKIVLLPLDERPCNYFYPSIMPLDEETKIVLPPLEILSNHKKVGDLQAISEWLINNSKDADYVIVSLDTLLYGGIVPSRLHHDSLENIQKRSFILRDIKQANPKVKIYANQLIMRCPAYSNAVEEPDYFDECGLEIWKCGVYLDKKSQGVLTPQDELDYQQAKAKVKDEYLNDVITRREINAEAIKFNLNLVIDNIIDFFSIPQDDCAPYGFSSIDRRNISKYISDNKIKNVMMYPGADEVGLDLISRAINDNYKTSLRVYPYFVDKNILDKVPLFEDRPIKETLSLHLKASGCKETNSLFDADIVYVVNTGDAFLDLTNPNEKGSFSSLKRDLPTMLNIINVGKSENRTIAIADVAYVNEADGSLIKLLKEKKLDFKIDSFAGWNTCSNTLGTTTCGAVSSYFSKDKNKIKQFLKYRYIEDYLYMGIVRRELIDFVSSKEDSSFSIANFGALEEECEYLVTNRLTDLAREANLLEKNEHLEVSFPWHRSFEIFLKIIKD